MRRVLATERGDELYSRRLRMVEPVFGEIKTNRRIGRFKRRGRAAARSEWRLIAATHNLLKLPAEIYATPSRERNSARRVAARSTARGVKEGAARAPRRLPLCGRTQAELGQAL
jgi:hypothetical protein